MTEVKAQVYSLLQEKDMTIMELMEAIYPNLEGTVLRRRRSTVQKAVARLIKWDKIQKNGS